MKRLGSGLLLSVLTFMGNYAFADHAAENAYVIAQLAYRLADTAEALEREALYDGGWNGPIDRSNLSTEAEADNTPSDHRRDNLRRLGQGARRLHLDASHLYRSANSGGFSPVGPGVQDHRGDRIRESFERVRVSYRHVKLIYNSLSGYQISHHIHALMSDIVYAYNDLQYYVYGNNRE